MTESPGASAQATLSRDLADFLIEFSIAIHRYSMYPEGHPSLEPAALGLYDRSQVLLDQRQTLSIGVARTQLVIEGVATDERHPVLRDLAHRLHHHQLGAIAINRGAELMEFVDVLGVLSIDPDRSGEPLGTKPVQDLRWSHIQLYPVTFDRLEMLEGEGPDVSGDDIDRSRSAQLWLGMARAALEDQPDEEADKTEPAVVAKAINAKRGARAYDQAIVGYLLQIADELKVAGGEGAVMLRRRMGRLVSALQPETLERLMDMGGDVQQRHKFVLDASYGMSVDAVIDVVKAAATQENQNISHSMVRMLSKLAQHADHPEDRIRFQADSAFRDNVRSLLAGWELDDPNPDGYRSALQQMAKSSRLFQEVVQAADEPEDERIIKTAIESGGIGPTVWACVARMNAEGRLGALLDVLDAGPRDNEMRGKLRARIAQPENLEVLLRTDPVDFRTLDRILPDVRGDSTRILFDALIEAESQGTRRGLLDRLAKMGERVGKLALERLTDERWYVQRNMLSLIGELRDLPPGFSPLPFYRHRDARVRREALRIGIRLEKERTHALCTALTDDDERTVSMAMNAAITSCPSAAIPLVTSRVNDRELAEDVRATGLHVLGSVRTPMAVEMLLHFVHGRRSLFGGRRLPTKTPLLIAALEALSRGWRDHPGAAIWIDLAAASSDEDIRNAVTRNDS